MKRHLHFSLLTLSVFLSPTIQAAPWLPTSLSAAPRSPSLNPPREEQLELENRRSTTQSFVKPAAAPSVEWTYHRTADGLHPNGNEQQIFWLMNRARQAPTAEGIWLATTQESEIASARNFFNIDTQLLQSQFAGYAAKPPAAFDVRLYNAAKVHSDDLIARDAQDHNNQFQRITDAGFHYSSGRGSVFSYATSALNAHGAWNIDWGGTPATGGMQSPPGHRMAVMAVDGNYTNVGIAAVPESDPNTQVGPLVVTGNYCQAIENSVDHFNRFIVGTVWRDKNANGRYDPGEGSQGVLVKPDQGTYFAMTSAGGGYAIPIATGNYQVLFSGGDIGADVTKPVSVGAQSVLLDLQFTLNSTYPLTVNVAGAGTVGGGGNYAAGATVTLTATPNAGNVFAGWSPSPCAASFTMPANALICTATFTSSTPNPAPVTGPLFSGDYNGDGKADVVWHNSTTGYVYGMLLNGLSIAAQGMFYHEPNTAWRIIGNGDFTGDHQSDLLWWNSQTGQVYLMVMNGLTIAGGQIVYQETDTAWRIVAVGDLNRDGRADLIWRNSQTGYVYGMLMNGASILQGAMFYHEADLNWGILAARDFTGDGSADLLWYNTATGHVYLMVMDGLNSTGGAMFYQEPNLAWRIVAVGDLNGDGKADLVWWNSQSGQVYGMLMNGAVIAQQGTVYQEADTAWHIVAFGDYNGDGKADLLWRHNTTGQIYEMLMDGLNIIGGAVIYQEANADWRIVANTPPSLLPGTGKSLVGGFHSVPLAGEPLNAVTPWDGDPVNPYQPMDGEPINPAQPFSE